MKLQIKVLVLLIFALTLLAGCVAVDGRPLADLLVAPNPAPVVEAEDVEPVEFELLPMAETEPLSALEVFAQVSPAVAFVETPRGTGSGILLEGGYVVSNAHVVWPYNSVRLVFPDGTEFEEAEVIGWDLMADLALVRVPDAEAIDATPVTFVDGSELAMASDIYLIGYPGEVESYPQPSISQGILARVRTWAATGMQVFQVDADITGGQSGGVMVTERGEVIGITTFNYTDASYAMVPSAAYAVPRLNALANQSNAGFSDRRPLGLATASGHARQLEDEFDSDIYVVEAEPGEDVEISVEGVGYPSMSASSINYPWEPLQSEEEEENIQSINFTVEEGDGPYIVRVAQASPYRNEYTLSSSHPLALYEDGDDQTEMAVGDVMTAAIDLPHDADWFTFELAEGEKVAIEIDSLVVDPVVTLLYDTPLLQEVFQSSSGGATNVFGENARIVFEAPQDGSYRFAVESTSGDEVGGYFVSLTEADADEELSEAVQSRALIPSSYGAMVEYESERFDFTIHRPAFWSEIACPEGGVACYQSSTGAGLYIVEEDLDRIPVEMEDKSQESYADLVEAVILSSIQGAEIAAREPFTTPQGIVGVKFIVNAQAGLATFSRFVYVNEDEIAFNATYFAATRDYEELEDFIDYSFRSFREWNEDTIEDDPVYYLDEGARLAREKEYEAALEAWTQAIELDDELVEAYAERGVLYETMGEYDLAIADFERLLELDPEDVSFVGQLALIYWRKGDLETALTFADEAIEREPEGEGYYNNRALIRATAGEFEGALDDMEELEELMDVDEIPANYLDTRAYVYLKMEEYDKAIEDYEAALDQDFKSPYVLFGAGIAHTQLDEMGKAMPLLHYGMELYEDEREEYPNPQLADLLEQVEEILAANP